MAVLHKRHTITWCEHATTVDVVVYNTATQEERKTPLHKDANDVFSVEMELLPGKYHFYYLVAFSKTVTHS